MEKNYVSYETALKLKELGFDEKCNSVYRNEQHIREEIITKSDDGYYELTVDSGCGILVMDVVEWLCDKHNIIVTYVPDWVSPSDTKFHYDFKIFLN